MGRDLWVLFETNGYGLTPGNLDALREAGIDSFWFDIKAHDGGVHRRFTGYHLSQWDTCFTGRLGLRRGLSAG